MILPQLKWVLCIFYLLHPIDASHVHSISFLISSSEREANDLPAKIDISILRNGKKEEIANDMVLSSDHYSLVEIAADEDGNFISSLSLVNKNANGSRYTYMNTNSFVINGKTTIHNATSYFGKVNDEVNSNDEYSDFLASGIFMHNREYILPLKYRFPTESPEISPQGDYHACFPTAFCFSLRGHSGEHDSGLEQERVQIVALYADNTIETMYDNYPLTFAKQQLVIDPKQKEIKSILFKFVNAISFTDVRIQRSVFFDLNSFYFQGQRISAETTQNLWSFQNLNMTPEILEDMKIGHWHWGAHYVFTVPHPLPNDFFTSKKVKEVNDELMDEEFENEIHKDIQNDAPEKTALKKPLVKENVIAEPKEQDIPEKLEEEVAEKEDFDEQSIQEEEDIERMMPEQGKDTDNEKKGYLEAKEQNAKENDESITKNVQDNAGEEIKAKNNIAKEMKTKEAEVTEITAKERKAKEKNAKKEALKDKMAAPKKGTPPKKQPNSKREPKLNANFVTPFDSLQSKTAKFKSKNDNYVSLAVTIVGVFTAFAVATGFIFYRTSSKVLHPKKDDDYPSLPASSLRKSHSGLFQRLVKSNQKSSLMHELQLDEDFRQSQMELLV